MMLNKMPHTVLKTEFQKAKHPAHQQMLETRKTHALTACSMTSTSRIVYR